MKIHYKILIIIIIIEKATYQISGFFVNLTSHER